MVYNIEIRYKGKPVYRAPRRYKEFAELDSQLRGHRVLSKLIAPIIFPPKKIFDSFTDSFVKERRHDLERYMKHLFVFEKVRSSAIMKAFLNTNVDALAAPPQVVSRNVKRRDSGTFAVQKLSIYQIWRSKWCYFIGTKLFFAADYKTPPESNIDFSTIKSIKRIYIDEAHPWGILLKGARDLVLATSMEREREEWYTSFVHVLESIALGTSLEKPEIVEDPLAQLPNLFAGPKSAAKPLTKEQIMDEDEIEEDIFDLFSDMTKDAWVKPTSTPDFLARGAVIKQNKAKA
eukprot:TRINITY_DN1047_c0_g2_i5.p1 TRINITY_DN1047_c0_g2~~TRINITY_DN1047_c0_g2_i5.p1  ORF type:complete len:290 (+),score=20.18 TRINITY_DN1047_c0_g2_i5:82-951(+)